MRFRQRKWKSGGYRVGHICFVDYTISVGVERLEDERRGPRLSASLTGDHFNGVGERGRYEEPVLSQEVSARLLDT